MTSSDALMNPWRETNSLLKTIALILGLLFLLSLILSRVFGWSCNTAAAPVAATAPAAVVKAPAAVETLGWNWVDGKLRLTGAVKDEATKKAIYDAAVKRMGDAAKVVDEIKIDTNAVAYGFGQNYGDIAGWGKGDLGISVNGKRVVLTGTVPVEGEKTQRGEAAARHFGPDYTIDNQIVVKAPAAVKPVSLYFDTGKFDVQADAPQLLKDLVAYGNASPNSKIQVTGYHDKRGDPDKNAELAKNRAKAVRETLKKLGLAEDRIILVPPVVLVGSPDDKEARRVDVLVAQ